MKFVVTDVLGDCGGYGSDKLNHDFIYVDDVAAVGVWFLQNLPARAIFNLGAARAQPFNDIALGGVNALWQLRGKAPLALDGRVR